MPTGATTGTPAPRVQTIKTTGKPEPRVKTGKGTTEPKRSERQGRREPAVIPFEDEYYGQPTPEDNQVHTEPHQ